MLKFFSIFICSHLISTQIKMRRAFQKTLNNFPFIIIIALTHFMQHETIAQFSKITQQ